MHKAREFFKRVRGEARVSSGGAAGSVRPSFETVFFLFFFFVSNRVFGACARTWNVFRRFALLLVVLARCVGLWAPGDVLEFQHLHYDGSSQESSLGLMYDNVGGEALNVLLFVSGWTRMEVTVSPVCMPRPRFVTGFPQSSP